MTTPLFVLSMDLRLAYDSVPRKALWCVLEGYRVPPTMLSVIRFFHENMTAVVRVGDNLTRMTCSWVGRQQMPKQLLFGKLESP